MLMPCLGDLREADARLPALAREYLSLAPSGRRPRSLYELGCELLPGSSVDEARALSSMMIGWSESVARNFPDNLFWDFDLPVASILADARASGVSVDYLDDATQKLVSLSEVFGCHTAIGFRYVHDFLYGFDWARWVGEDPAARSAVGPFELTFLERMLQRGQEILEAISRGGDERYPRLAAGHARNVYRFSREPDDEIALHRVLSARGLLPAEAWSSRGATRWGVELVAARSALAEQLDRERKA